MKFLTVTSWLMLVSTAIWIVFLISIMVNTLWTPTFEEVGHLQIGCYKTDALWFYVKCQGFTLAEVVGFLLTIPYLLWFGPLLIFFNPFIAIPLWFFLFFPAWYVWSKWRHTSLLGKTRNEKSQ